MSLTSAAPVSIPSLEQITRRHAERPVRLRPLPRRVDEIRGEGPWGLHEPCEGYVRVTRYETRELADAALAKGWHCTGRCWPGQHRVIGPLKERPVIASPSPA